MVLAVTSEQIEFAESVRHWATARNLLSITRRLLDGVGGVADEIESLWGQMAELGWTGLLVPEALGGSGASWADAVILVEEMGAACGPVPLATTLAASTLLSQSGSRGARPLLEGVADGTVRFGVSPAAGSRPVVVAGSRATHLAIRSGDDVEIYLPAAVELTLHAQLDPSSGTCEATPTADPVLRLPGAADRLSTMLRLFLAADSVGVSSACLGMAVRYASDREAFGRVIGSFQAIKHHCADMMLASQLAAGATWRAAAGEGGADERALVDGAAYLAATAALTCAKTALQVHGGIGFTWEHDIHLYLRRAGVTSAHIGPMETILEAAGKSQLDDTRPSTTLEMPLEAEPVRHVVTEFRRRVLERPEAERQALIVDEGYLHPHWPTPWGRAADPLEQLVIEDVLRDVDRVSALGPTFWEVPIVLPTVLDCGTPDQIERWMRPSMMGEIHWCQLFSEPSAGSDLAALRTRAVKTEGGWLVSGQKVWTSDAHNADLGMALVRTDPDARKHRGITCLVVNMRAPGVDIRPLRQINGEAHFNEVFLDEVFVPDEDVIGEVNDGWSVARTTLGHERVSLGANTSVWTSGRAWQAAIELTRTASVERPALIAKLGRIVLASEGASSLHLRSTYRALIGQREEGAGSIGKTVIADLAHQVGDYSLDLLGESASFEDGDQAALTAMFLQARSATIAGGTSEILRTLLAEQMLGLPREPSPALSGATPKTVGPA